MANNDTMVVKYAQVGTGNASVVLSTTGRFFAVRNIDTENELTVIIDGMMFPVAASDSFSEYFAGFVKIEVVASGDWAFYVKA